MNEGKIVFPLRPGVCSPKFVATADIHLGKKLYNMPELEEDLKDNFVRLVDLTIDKKVDYLVIVGDLFEDNSRVKPNMVAFIANQVERLKQHNIRTVGIAGDHDKPVQKEAWVHISGIEPVTIEPAFAGIDYFDYSSVTIDELLILLKDRRDSNKVLWLFLHCQFPQVFDKAEAKKTIDYNKLKLFENFPNIQGIIAGDLHFAPETKAYGVNHEAYVGYPGSLGITDKSEYKHSKHVLYCDGKNLMHLPFKILRQMRDIEFRGKKADEFDVDTHIKWAKALPIKPVIYIYYDRDSENQMHKTASLYQYALIKMKQVAVEATDLDNDEETISCRTEASSGDKIDKALRHFCNNDEELYKLSSSLLKDDDIRGILDKFKDKYEL